ncbi:amino acid kinase family protein, partial [Pedobacter sp.]
MKVLKFGGTSVGTTENIKTLLKLVKDERKNANPIVVLSAMSGVTNLLLEMAELAEKGESYHEQLKNIEQKHFDVVKALLPAAAQNPILTKLKLHFNELEDALQAVSSLKELSLRTKDFIVSFGERCSNSMVAHIATQYFDNSLYVDGSKLIKTDSDFGSARVDFKLTDELIKEFYEENNDKVLFVTGFIASNAANQITTLGRGGSDYTAAIWG